MQDGLDGAADEGEDDHVVVAAAEFGEELGAGHLHGAAVRLPDARLAELARGGGGPAAQYVPGGCGGVGGEAAGGEGAPFPAGVGIREYGDALIGPAAAEWHWHPAEAIPHFR
ncbi:hypothetical protein Sros01_53570 [Streptomyces roseochromogenus]|nr:hypothetical protein Sros01_53570 [Streptomyces roseochromogenus]